MERAQVQRPSPVTMKTSRRFVDSSRVDAVNKSSERLAGNSACCFSFRRSGEVFAQV